MYVKCWGTRGSLPVPTSHERFLTILEDAVVQGSKIGVTSAYELLTALKDGRLNHPIVFGGNTSCTEIHHAGQSVYIDMGSGFREA